MAFIVEDGTGRVDANALISLEYADDYFEDRGIATWASRTDAEKQSAIIRATDFMGSAFLWQGFPVNGRDQLCPFPRYGMTDKTGYSIDTDSVPREILAACAVIAEAEAASPKVMSPTHQPSKQKKAVKMGPISVTYDLSGVSAESARPVLLDVQALISPFLKQQVSSHSAETALS